MERRENIPSRLSREEEEELVWSKKKVKEGSDADFQDGSKLALAPVSCRFWAVSFKDKLVEEIPGAHEQAFDFAEFKEAVPYVELESIREQGRN